MTNKPRKRIYRVIGVLNGIERIASEHTKSPAAFRAMDKYEKYSENPASCAHGSLSHVEHWTGVNWQAVTF